MKIINMAERLKDEADRKLEMLFGADPVADNGFSVQVVRRVRQKMWVQRLSMPVAIAVGAAIAAKPLQQLIGAIPDLLAVIPVSISGLDSVSTSSLPQSSTVLLGTMLLGAVLMVSQMLED